MYIYRSQNEIWPCFYSTLPHKLTFHVIVQQIFSMGVLSMDILFMDNSLNLPTITTIPLLEGAGDELSQKSGALRLNLVQLALNWDNNCS